MANKFTKNDTITIKSGGFAGTHNISELSTERLLYFINAIEGINWYNYLSNKLEKLKQEALSRSKFKIGDIIVIDWKNYNPEHNAIYIYKIKNIYFLYSNFGYVMNCYFSGRFSDANKCYDEKFLTKLKASKINDISIFEELYD